MTPPNLALTRQMEAGDSRFFLLGSFAVEKWRLLPRLFWPLTLELSQIGDTYIWVLFAVSVVTAEQRGSMRSLLEVSEGKQQLSFKPGAGSSFFKMFSCLDKKKRRLFWSPRGKPVGHPVTHNEQ